MNRPHDPRELAIWQREPVSKRAFDISVALLPLVALLPVQRARVAFRATD